MRRATRMPLLLAFAAGALLAAGCGQRSEPTGATVPLYPVTVDNPRGAAAVALQSAPARVAVLDSEGERILRVLGVRAVRAADVHGNPRQGVLAQTKPGLVVAGPSNDPLRLRGLQKSLHAPIYVADGSSIAGVERSILELARLTGHPLRGRQLVGSIEQARRQVAAQHRGQPQPRVFVDLGLFTTVGADTLVGEVIGAAGGRDVVGGAVDRAPVSTKRLRKLDPDVYLASSDSGTTLRDLRADPTTARLRAVRDGRFAVVPARLLQAGPALGQAIRVLAATIHAGSGAGG